MDSDKGKLFIGGISWETSEEKLKDYFGHYGEVLQAVVMKDKATGKPRGFGFVVFADPDILDRVLQDTHVLDGRTVEAKKALSREEQQVSKSINPSSGRNFSSGGGGGNNNRTKKIFIGGLPPTLSEDTFRDYFETFGTVTDVVIMFDNQTTRPRGFGFISFDSEDSVDRVLHKKFHNLNGKQVEVKRALPKDANPGGSGRSIGSEGNRVGYSGMDSNRYMQSQNIGGGGGYPVYGSFGYGYGPTNNGLGYGGYGYGYSGGYGGFPVGAPRGSWCATASAGYGNMGFGISPWGTNGAGGSGSVTGGAVTVTGHSPSGAGGYGYGYAGNGNGDTNGSQGWRVDQSNGNHGGTYGGGAPPRRQAKQL